MSSVRITQGWPLDTEPYVLYVCSTDLGLSNADSFPKRATVAKEIREVLCEHLETFNLQGKAVVSYGVFNGKHVTIFGFSNPQDAVMWKLAVDLPLYIPYFSRLNGGI